MFFHFLWFVHHYHTVRHIVRPAVQACYAGPGGQPAGYCLP